VKPHLYILPLLLATVLRLHAQSSDVTSGKPAIHMIANPRDNKIMLRWAPTTPGAWEYANRYGYSLQRVTLLRDNNRVRGNNKVMLTQNLIAQPLAAWETEVKKNKYAAVAAQALYGKTFQVKQQDSNITQLVNQVKERDQRFSFALFAADYSPAVAELSGLAFTDSQVTQDENYLYKIWVNMPDKKNAVDTGFVYVGLRDERALPVPQKPEIQFMDKTAILSWNYGYHARTYIAYVVERSAAGDDRFTSITKDPIVPAENTPEASGIMHVVDTLADNTMMLNYRIRGITAFGETGPPTPLLSGHGKKALSAAPALKNVTVQDNQRVALQWDYPAALRSDLKGFQVERALMANGPFTTISPVLPPDLTTYTDNKPGSSNYYRIAALGLDDKTYSFPHLAQLLDSISPASPAKLIASIDTTGRVTLKWDAGKEPDLLGYRVYRSNFKAHEYWQITTDPVSDPVFYDTVNLKTLTQKIYYKVVAVDRHFNPSELSAAVVVTKPDLLPPATPAFTNITYDEGKGIQLHWMASSSTDLKHHLLYKRTSTDNTWRLNKVVAASDRSGTFTDNEVHNKRAYEYRLVAVDSAGWESAPSASVRISVNDRSNKPTPGNVSATSHKDKKQIHLSWSYDLAGVHQFRIYRKGEDGHMRLFASVPGNLLHFSDRQLTLNTPYEYTIQAVFADGAQSPFSKAVKIVY
jgi:uncharacterized protein